MCACVCVRETAQPVSALLNACSTECQINCFGLLFVQCENYLSLSHAHARTISLSLSHTHTHFLSLWIMCAKPSSSTYAPFLSLHGRFVTSHQAQPRCAGNVRVVHGEGGYAGSVRVVCRKGECAGSVRVYIRCLHLSRPIGPGYV